MTTTVWQIHDGLPISLTDSSGVLMVIAQKSAKPLATPHTPLSRVSVIRGKRALAKEKDLRQTLLFYTPYPAFRVCIQIELCAGSLDARVALAKE
jgi:hypothetical protein